MIEYSKINCGSQPIMHTFIHIFYIQLIRTNIDIENLITASDDAL